MYQKLNISYLGAKKHIHSFKGNFSFIYAVLSCLSLQKCSYIMIEENSQECKNTMHSIKGVCSNSSKMNHLYTKRMHKARNKSPVRYKIRTAAMYRQFISTSAVYLFLHRYCCFPGAMHYTQITPPFKGGGRKCTKQQQTNKKTQNPKKKTPTSDHS